jgi:hypothetical protein
MKRTEWRDVTAEYRSWPAIIHLETRAGADIKVALFAVRASQRDALTALVDRAVGARESTPVSGTGSPAASDGPWDPFDTSR